MAKRGNIFRNKSSKFCDRIIVVNITTFAAYRLKFYHKMWMLSEIIVKEVLVYFCREPAGIVAECRGQIQRMIDRYIDRERER